MARIIIASASDTIRGQQSRLLASYGSRIFRVCRSGDELRRAMNECEDGIIVLWGIVPGCKPNELAWDYRNRAQVLFIAHPETLSNCERKGVFSLKMPCSPDQIIGAVEMLSQLHGMRLPKRTAEDKALVESAKLILMQEKEITEPEAHRFMQRYAMRHGIKMAEYAKQLLEGKNDHA